MPPNPHQGNHGWGSGGWDDVVEGKLQQSSWCRTVVLPTYPSDIGCQWLVNQPVIVVLGHSTGGQTAHWPTALQHVFLYVRSLHYSMFVNAITEFWTTMLCGSDVVIVTNEQPLYMASGWTMITMVTWPNAHTMYKTTMASMLKLATMVVSSQSHRLHMLYDNNHWQ